MQRRFGFGVSGPQASFINWITWLAPEEVEMENEDIRYAKESQKLGMRKHARTQTRCFSQGIVREPNRADRERRDP